MLLGACSGGGGSAATSSSTPPSTTAPRVDDGTLVVGAVLPRGGSNPDLGGSMRAALELAITEINDSGGVLGAPVELYTREEGDDANTSLLAVQELVQLGVDAIVGPTSSVTLLNTLSTAVDSGVLTCAPTASALALDDFPDRGLLVRTVPSDSLEAVALAGLVDDSGTSSAVVVYLDDAYGRPFADAVFDALRDRGTAVDGPIGFTDSDESIDETATEVAALAPEMVVVVADAATGPAIIGAIDEAAPSPKPTYAVNDALRRPDASATPFGGFLASRIVGASPLAVSTSEAFDEALDALRPDTGGLFAENVYDCVNLIALGAQSTGSTLAADIAAAIPSVSSGGSGCTSFQQCNSVLADDRNPDYDGPSGVLTLGPEGDPTSALFERFGFDDTGRDVGTAVVVAGSG